MEPPLQVLSQFAGARHAAQKQAQAFAAKRVLHARAHHEFPQVSRARLLQLALQSSSG
jgi:hypothetical protein